MDGLEVHRGTAIARDGTRIAYQTSGSGPALVCCHAMGMDQDMWEPQRVAFSRSYQFISFDQRGSGLSGHPEFSEGPDSAYTIEKFGDDLAAVLDQTAIERARILGFSMGALAALSFATRWPERVERLILASAMASRLPEEIVSRARRVEDVLDAEGLDKAYEFYFGGALFRGLGERDSSGGLLERARARASAHGFKGCFRVTIDRPSMLDQLARIQAPTLILVGEHDTHYLPEADLMAGKLPDARKVVIANAGHPMAVENPESFEREVLSFLGDSC